MVHIHTCYERLPERWHKPYQCARGTLVRRNKLINSTNVSNITDWPKREKTWKIYTICSFYISCAYLWEDIFLHSIYMNNAIGNPFDCAISISCAIPNFLFDPGVGTLSSAAVRGLDTQWLEIWSTCQSHSYVIFLLRHNLGLIKSKVTNGETLYNLQ